jgi:hypothetical protein
MKTFSKVKMLLAASAVSFTPTFAAPAAAALLQGNVLQISLRGPDINTVNTAPSYSGQLQDNVVGISGTYFLNVSGFPSPLAAISPHDRQIIIYSPFADSSFFASVIYYPHDFNGFAFRDMLNNIDPFTSVTVSALNTLTGFDGARISFDADNIFINLSGLTFYQGQRAVLDINPISAPPPVGGVPEPAGWALLIAGFGLTAAAMRRRRGVRTFAA